MAEGTGGSGGDKPPGRYKIISINGATDAIRISFDQAEAEGYEFVAMNNDTAVFYKETKK